jgi:hypothetical protein
MTPRQEEPPTNRFTPESNLKISKLKSEIPVESTGKCLIVNGFAVSLYK